VRLSEHFLQRLFALGRLSADIEHFALHLFLNDLHDFPCLSETSLERPDFHFVEVYLAAGVVGSVKHSNSTQQQNTVTQRLFLSAGPASGVVGSFGTYVC
jgi:hypothetical protein